MARENHGKKKFLLTESSKSINNTIIFSYLQNNLEMEWIGYEGEFSVPVCLEIICVAESQNEFWDIIRWTTSWISNTPWDSNGLKVRTWRHPNRRLSVYDQPGNQYVSRSCFVRHGSFQQIHCFRFLTCLDYFRGLDKISFDSSDILKYPDLAPDITELG